jgi:hypothetical protein
MKKIILSILILSSTLAFAQTKGSAKLYGYKEGVVSGRPPKTAIDESGHEKKEAGRSAYNYFIYISSSSSITPVELWINGISYAVKTSTVAKTPVERKNENNAAKPSTKVLVPKTKSKVWLLTPAPSLKAANAKGKELAKTNELVVIYTFKGKQYYTSLRSLTALEPAAAL